MRESEGEGGQRDFGCGGAALRFSRAGSTMGGRKCQVGLDQAKDWCLGRLQRGCIGHALEAVK